MDAAVKGILTLVRSAVTGEVLPLPEGFDIGQASRQIRRHQITPLAYEGAVRCGIDRSLPVMQELFGICCRRLLQSERQMAMLEKVCARFDENGIDYMPLKGANLKKIYPRPDLRLMGDVDILVRQEQYAKIIPIVEQLGFEAQYESDHELVWKSDALLLELHKRVIPSYNQDYYAYFGDGWRLAAPKEGSRYAMKPEDEFIYLFTHFAKHYRDGGIGIRHVTDLWVWKRAWPNMDEAYLRQELKTLQLLAFYDNVCRLLQLWFEDGAEDEKTAFMTRFLLDSGVWGREEDRMISGSARGAAVQGSARKEHRRQLLASVFPGVEQMKTNYPVVEKLPFLLPLLWPVRWLKGLLLRRDSVKIHRKKLQLSSVEHVETYQQALRYVGLDFNFEE